MENKLCFTIPEAAELLSISKYTLYRMIHRNEISYRKIGKRLLLERSTIENLGKVTL